MKKVKYEIFIKLFLLLLITCYVISCKDEITSPPEKSIYTKVLKGKVILENQTEHSNALVYLDSLNRGAGTDSSGNYTLQFSDEDTIYNGVFKIYYFVTEFEMDSALYVLENGKVKLDSLDVDSDGNLPTKELRQLVLVEGWTDKQEYRAGDTIQFTARFTNVTNRTVHIHIYSAYNELGPVGLYNENYPPFDLTPCWIVDINIDVFMNPNGFYEGNVAYIIPDTNYCNINTPPLLLDDYLVITVLSIEDRLINQFQSKFSKYVLENWYKFHRGKTPKLDWFPNKYTQ
jgi:hypothetical protein